MASKQDDDVDDDDMIYTLAVLTAISRWTWVSRNQNVFILDFTEAG